MNSCVIDIVHSVGININRIRMSTGPLFHRFSVWIIHEIYSTDLLLFSCKDVLEGRPVVQLPILSTSVR